MPPSNVNIGQVFRIKVKATISDGTPISRAIIICNTTQGINVSSVSSSTLLTQLTSTDVNPVTVANLTDLGSEKDNYLKALQINESEVDTRNPEVLFAEMNKRIKTLNLSESSVQSLKKDYMNKFLGNVDKQNLLFILGKGDIGLDILSSLNKRTSVMLESVSGNIRTGSDGLATITLRFTAGISDKYYLQCQSGQVFTPKSLSIQLNNTISQIKFVDPIDQTISLSFLKNDQNEILPTYIPLVPVINVRILQNLGQPYAGVIYDLQIKIVDYDFITAAMSKLHTDVSNYTLSEIQLVNSFGDNGAVKERLNRLWNILTTGANALINSLGNEQVVQTKNANLNSLSQYYQMNNLQIQLTKPGKYQLIISVNGIESQRSGVITVINDQYAKKSDFERFTPSILLCLVYALSLFLCLINIAKTHSLLSLIGLISVSLGIALVCFQIQYQSYFSIFMLTTFGLLAINLIEVIFIKIFGNEEKSSHQLIKKEIFHEYTYQQMYHKPSTKWVSIINMNIFRSKELNQYSKTLMKQLSRKWN